MKNIPIMKPYFTEDEAQETAAALASGWVAQGPRVAQFEKAVCAYEGVAYGVACTNCTTALHLIMAASGFGPGQDVIVPSYTFVATANAVMYVGATPILTDVDIRTYNIDVPKAEELILSRYSEKSGHWVNKESGNILSGIVPVNLFGLCADIPAVEVLAQKYGLKIVEDSACAFGAKIGDTFESKFGHPAALSFHPRKSITTGEGGMVLTDDEQLATHMRQMRSHSASLSEVQRHLGAKGYLLPDYNEIGFNYRMTDIQAAVGIAQMRKMDMMSAKRAEIAMRYDKILPEAVPFIDIPYVPDGYTHIYQTYACMINIEKLGLPSVEAGNEFRNKVMDHLEQDGIATRQGTHAVHLLGQYRQKYGYQAHDLPVAFACDRLSIAIPMYVEMTQEEQDYVIERLAFWGQKVQKEK